MSMRLDRVLIFGLAAAIGVLTASAAAEAPLVIAQRGAKSEYVISLPKDASACLRHAAEEFAKYVRAMTEVELPVVEGRAEGCAVVLHSGRKENVDAFTFMAHGRNFIIHGASDRAVLFAVYDFLENQCGCEWLSAVHEIVPRRESVAVLADFRLERRPGMVNRECGWTEAYENPDFAAKLKLNGYRFAMVYGDRQGGKPPAFDDVLSICHTFRKILPAEQHFAEHPEWFSEVNGRRVEKSTQLCLTNPEVLAKTIEFVKERIRKCYPRVKAYGVSQNDWWNYCTCKNCRELDEREGSHAGTLINFVNQVADAVAEEYPDVLIETLAYMYSYLPPKHLQCRDNVMITFCTDAYDMSRPLEGNRYRPGGRAPFAEVLKAWSQRCRHIYLWDYAFNFCYLNLAFPNVYTMGKNISFYARNGVDAMYEEGAHHGRHAESSELKLWLAAHLMWEPTLDDRQLIDRFLKAYFGAGAPFAAKYYDEMYRLQPDEAKYPQRMWGRFFSPVMTDAFFELAAGLWKDAAKAVEGDERRSYNVRWAMNANDYTRIFRSNLGAIYECTRHPEYVESPAFKELHAAARRIVADLEADNWKGRLGEDRDGNRRGERRIRNLAALDPATIRRQETVRIPGDFLSFAGTQLWLSDVHTDPDAKYRLRVKLNLRKKPNAPASGCAVYLQIFDLIRDQPTATRRDIEVKDIVEGPAWYELPGAHSLRPHHRLDLVDATYDVKAHAANPFVEKASIDEVEIRFADIAVAQDDLTQKGN